MTRDVQAVTILTMPAAAGVVADFSLIKSLNTVPPSFNQADGRGIVSQDASAPIPLKTFASLPSLARPDIVGIPTS